MTYNPPNDADRMQDYTSGFEDGMLAAQNRVIEQVHNWYVNGLLPNKGTIETVRWMIRKAVDL